VVGIERLQRVAPDRRQAQATLAADLLRPCQRLGGMVAMVVGMAAGRAVRMLAIGLPGIVILRVWLHFCHVALQ
jgi:hypothetical protein